MSDFIFKPQNIFKLFSKNIFNRYFQKPIPFFKGARTNV